MKKILFLISFLLVLDGCSRKKDIPELLEGNFQSRLVSFENTKPQIDLDSNNLKEILVLLHHRIPEEKIREHFNLSDSVWNVRINYLFGQGLVKKTDDGKYLPTFFILDKDNYQSIRKFVDSLGTEMSGIALDRLSKIKDAYSKIPSIKNIPFDYASMFILGSVVHDHWQDKFYQEQFIKAFIPHRGSAFYYLALIQDDGTGKNSPQIFQTSIHNFPGFQVGSYSLLKNESNLATYPTKILTEEFGKKESEKDSSFKAKLISELIGLSKNSNIKIEEKHRQAFEKNGLLINGKLTLPIISKTDQQKLFGVASIITADLVNYFENRQTFFVKRYLNSQYREETNYKEWMVWVYKLIASRAVEELIRKSVIKCSVDRSAFFILENK